MAGRHHGQKVDVKLMITHPSLLLLIYFYFNKEDRLMGNNYLKLGLYILILERERERERRRVDT